jgi:hypothetical protein
MCLKAPKIMAFLLEFIFIEVRKLNFSLKDSRFNDANHHKKSTSKAEHFAVEKIFIYILQNLIISLKFECILTFLCVSIAN